VAAVAPLYAVDEEDKEVDNKKLYEMLEVDPKASDQEIRSSYKKLVLKHHPDKGGDPEKIKEINMAYEVLSDREKRELYDRYGLEGIKNGGGMPGGGFEDLFDLLGRGGGGGRPQGRQREKPKMKPTQREVPVTLEDIYSGKMLDLPHKKNAVCSQCSGTGGSGVKQCKDCDGQGAVIKTIQIGPGMYQRAQMACPKCKGRGETIDEAKLCKGCKGKKVLPQEKTVQVSVEAGTPSDHVIKISGEGEEHPDAQAGDLEVFVRVQKHKTFERKGADLFMEKEISLKEALLGFSFPLKFLDGKDLTISSVPGEVISHGDIKTVKGKGLPFYRDIMSHGNLIISFKVIFPDLKKISAEGRETLQKVTSANRRYSPAAPPVRPTNLHDPSTCSTSTSPTPTRIRREEPTTKKKTKTATPTAGAAVDRSASCSNKLKALALLH